MIPKKSLPAKKPSRFQVNLSRRISDRWERSVNSARSIAKFKCYIYLKLHQTIINRKLANVEWQPSIPPPPLFDSLSRRNPWGCPLKGRNNIRAFWEQVRGSLTVQMVPSFLPCSKPLILLFVPPFVVFTIPRYRWKVRKFVRTNIDDYGVPWGVGPVVCEFTRGMADLRREIVTLSRVTLTEWRCLAWLLFLGKRVVKIGENLLESYSGKSSRCCAKCY